MSCVYTELVAFQCDMCLQRTSNDIDACPARWFFQNFGDKWTLPVIGCLVAGPMRFSGLRKSLQPISERMLILTLKKLEEMGIITHGQSESVPSQSIYRLTPIGRSLLENVEDLFQWMNDNASAILDTYKTPSPSRQAVSGT